jgi:hypothetical protein
MWRSEDVSAYSAARDRHSQYASPPLPEIVWTLQGKTDRHGIHEEADETQAIAETHSEESLEEGWFLIEEKWCFCIRNQREGSMKIRVWVGTSRIAGKGLFAAQNISKGTRVIQYTGQRISKEETAERL